MPMFFHASARQGLDRQLPHISHIPEHSCSRVQTKFQVLHSPKDFTFHPCHLCWPTAWHSIIFTLMLKISILSLHHTSYIIWIPRKLYKLSLGQAFYPSMWLTITINVTSLSHDMSSPVSTLCRFLTSIAHVSALYKNCMFFLYIMMHHWLCNFFIKINAHYNNTMALSLWIKVSV